MKPEILKTLIEKDILTHKSEIEAAYRAIDISGSPLAKNIGVFSVKMVVQQKDKIYIDCVSVADGHRRKIDPVDVTKIDGMDIKRLFQVYGLSETGAKLYQGKRRGRKPKNYVPEPIENIG